MQRDQAHRTNELLERIAIALEKNNKKETVKDIPLTVTNDLATSPEVYESKENKLDYNDVYREDNIHNDYLNDLVMDMNQPQYLQFCHEMGWVSNDANRVTSNMYELEYEECLGAIKKALIITEHNNYVKDGIFGREYIINLIKEENTTDPETDLQGIIVDSDHDIRSTAKFYEEEYLKKEGATKKECILDYVTNEFGSHGARYSEITKFCYYLGASNTPVKHNATRDRGYYACALTVGPWKTGYLVTGGTNQLVKGINKEGNERYFALSEVESFTDYWNYLDRK